MFKVGEIVRLRKMKKLQIKKDGYWYLYTFLDVQGDKNLVRGKCDKNTFNYFFRNCKNPIVYGESWADGHTYLTGLENALGEVVNIPNELIEKTGNRVIDLRKIGKQGLPEALDLLRAKNAGEGIINNAASDPEEAGKFSPHFFMNSKTSAKKILLEMYKSVTGEHPVTCPVCSRTISMLTQIEKSYIHEGKTKTKCVKCGKPMEIVCSEFECLGFVIKAL